MFHKNVGLIINWFAFILILMIAKSELLIEMINTKVFDPITILFLKWPRQLTCHLT